MRPLLVLAVLIPLGEIAFAQHARIRSAPELDMPGAVDSNSPAYWRDSQLNLLNSTGDGPLRSVGPNQSHLGLPTGVKLHTLNAWPTWMEAVWLDTTTGIVFGWYHQEHWGVCLGGTLATPQIGAAISYDGGSSFQDLGAIITSSDPIDCQSQNGYFAGGTGDLSVMLDRNNTYFYFFYSVYAGPLEQQGVAIARMPFESRFGQPGAVLKYYNGDWNEPGLGGRETPIFPATVSWQDANTDAFWGPSVHWNTYLQSYVMLLNHSCCDPGFPQEGIYVSFSPDLSDPTSWQKPEKLMNDSGWYPQVLGSGTSGTDRQAGHTARLYIYGQSNWTIIFDKPPVATAAPPSQ